MPRTLVLAAAFLTLGCGPGSLPASIPHPLADATAPEFEAKSTTDEHVSVPAAGPIRVTVLDFWASWCTACSWSLPLLDEIWRHHKEDGVAVIGVNVDETVGVAERMASYLGLSFPIVYDQDQRIAGSYGVTWVPLTFVIDRSGRIRWVGFDPREAQRAVDLVLSEGAPPRDVFE